MNLNARGLKAAQNRLAKFIKDVMKMDPDNENIKWFGDNEDNNFYFWMFEFEKKIYRIKFDKASKKVSAA